MGWWNDWFKPVSPLNTPVRDWIRRHLRWFQDEFGDRLVEKPIVEPTDAFFSDPYDASPRSVSAMFRRICDWMEVDHSGVALQCLCGTDSLYFVTDQGHDFGVAAGTYHDDGDKQVVRVDESNAQDPFRLTATLAHELAHVRLLGENRIDPDRFDHELLTDLCADFFGYGIFLANRPGYSPPSGNTWPSSSVPCPEYMTVDMHAFALAVIAEVRFEDKPRWARHLKSGARAEWKAAMRWLRAEQRA